MQAPKRAKAGNPKNRRRSRRAVWDLIDTEGVPHSRRRARALRRAAARVKTDRATRKTVEKFVQQQFLVEKAEAAEIERLRRREESRDNADRAQR